MTTRSSFLLALSILTSWIPAGHADGIPVEVLFQRPKYGAMRLSPNGLYLAVVTRVNGRNNLGIIDFEKRDVKAITKLDIDVLSFGWLNNNRLFVAVGDAQEASGAPHFSQLYAVDRDGSSDRNITLRATDFFDLLADGGDDIVVGAHERGRSIHDLYRVNTRTRKHELLSFDSPGDVLTWVVDQEGIPRVAHTYSKGVHSIWYRDSDKSPWIKLIDSKESRLEFTPLALDHDNKTLYVAARHGGDRVGIYRYDVQAKKIGELVAGSAQADMGQLIFNRAKHTLLGVTYEGDKPGVAWFDPDMARLQKTVDAALPDTYNVLQVADENPHRAVVLAYSDVNPGTLYLLDTDKLRLEEIEKTRPWIDPKQMAERKPVHYAARDGLDIPAYLTLPKNLGKTKPALVVIIHGGPWARGHWGFNMEAQLFASRGYAVLEPEFRGSDGYGWKLLSAGFKQWGLAMEDDISDGVEWLVTQGVVDKDRVCLYGGSYGGYATLWGLMKTPDLYKCGVAFVAVTDINLLFDITWSDIARSSYGYLDYEARDVIGDPDKDRDQFRAVSPLYHADKLKAPVLLAYGNADQRVPLKHGNEFRAALDKNGKPYEWVTYTDEGHGFNKDENRFDFYRRVDAFVNKYLH